MPRTSSNSTVPAVVKKPDTKPTLGEVLVDSMTSGVGFGIGSSLARSLFSFGGSQLQPTQEYTQCLEANKLAGNGNGNGNEKDECYYLSSEYKACLIRTNFNKASCERTLY